jgi:hypothetical protein
VADAIVEAGACGFKVAIRATKVSEGILDGKLDLSISSPCQDVMGLSKDLNGERSNRDFFGKIDSNEVFKAAAKHIRCADCPVPAAILKVARVELGLALPKDMSVKFRNR